MTAPLEFQLATYELDPDWGTDPASLGPVLGPLINDGQNPFLVVEVVSDQKNDSFAVAVSVAFGDPKEPPSKLTCWLAYSNQVQWCDEARKVGFPIVEADIACGANAQTLTIHAARYALSDEPDGKEFGIPAALSVGPLLVIERPMLGNSARGTPAGTLALNPTYEKFRVVPDAADAGSSVLVRPSPWAPVRTLTAIFESGAGLSSAAAWYPALQRLLGNGKRDCRVAWAGTIANPLNRPASAPVPAAPVAPAAPALARGGPPSKPGGMATRPTWSAAPRRDLFGPPKFAFDDVELVGFRVDLSDVPGVMDELNRMVDGLNFHTRGDMRYADDFRYEVATPWLVIELLRYRKMRLTKNWPPVRTLDYQAQHELLLRVLVGRVDDDTAQARDAAIYVPAIFVDNPWSKALGREVQGFDKVLASFCTTSGGGPCRRLTMDGRLDAASTQRVPLMQVDRVSLVRRVGELVEKEAVVLNIDYGRGVDLTDRDFEQVDLRGVAGRMTPLTGPWRQSDFDATEFRRAFARPVLARGFGGFRSLQISPVDEDPRINEVGKTWIYGSMRTKDLRYRFPTGVASLELPDCKNAPPAWKKLRELMRDGKMSFPTGCWYRAQCSMVLSIEDGLRW
ncbi:hypothetical protein [Variovorax sp. YR216]|uniref:hypothetical protein n=1 Tax=Variovorax sp. YR216 TaxID=1882828 RepID=UPI00089A4053|nr:hypothetical protein [Variovorax sp. YR216]SEB16074.1 hypothetical protein SAMN05444680_110121 [Variovorax sp. YR216]